ncbi:terminase [Kitasatospora sp. NPDC003701]
MIRFLQEVAVQPDGERAGEPFRFSREQLRFIVWLYAIDDRGRFTYRRACLRRAKGHGKTPLLAALAVAEFIGPVRFAGWDAFGLPIGKAVKAPHVQLAATTYAQTANTLDMIRGMLIESQHPEAKALDIGKLSIQFRDGRPGRIEPVTASSSSLEGGRPSFCVMDETHHWQESTGGHRLWEVISRNLGKVGGRSVESTNAFSPGYGSVAERTHEAFLEAQKAGGHAGLLYDCLEAFPDVDLADEESVRLALRQAYGDSHWAGGAPNWEGLDRIVDEIYDPGSDAGQMRRFYLNQIVSASDGWLSHVDVDAAVRPDEIPPGALVVLGFDGSRKRDATAIVATDVRTMHSQLLNLWECPDGPEAKGWEVPAAEVDAAVASAFERFDVCGFAGDRFLWDGWLDIWAQRHRTSLHVKAGRHVTAWDMAAQMKDLTYTAESTASAFAERKLTIGPEAALIRHLKNAKRRPNSWGAFPVKENKDSARKVDAAHALLLSRAMARKAVDAGVLEKRKARSGKVYVF